MVDKAIGVFDSGAGGLTVLKALREVLPNENYIYLGDMARLPYGTKSAETVTQYALQATRRLMKENIKFLVVACNTASAHAYANLKKEIPTLLIQDVISPGAAAAIKASATGRIAVLATEGTIRSGAYTSVLQGLRPEIRVKSLAANLLVALVEEGWNEGPEALTIIERYLKDLGTDFDTLVLGCTHFPLLKPLFQRLLPLTIKLVDSAASTAEVVASQLRRSNLLTTKTVQGRSQFLVTDSPERFRHLALKFLEHDIADDVSLIDMAFLHQGK